MAFALAWDISALYMGLKTIDDTHQNPGSGWNGDTIQIAFTNADRDLPAGDMILYNYGLSDDQATTTLHHQRHPCPDADDCTDAAMRRNDESSVNDTPFVAVFPPPLPCVSTALRGQDTAFALRFHCPSRPRHRLCLAFPLPFATKTPPLPCVSTALRGQDTAFALQC